MLTMNRKLLAVLAFASALAVVLTLAGCGGGGSEDPSASSTASDPSIAEIAPAIPYGESLAALNVQARETHQTVYVQGQ